TGADFDFIISVLDQNDCRSSLTGKSKKVLFQASMMRLCPRAVPRGGRQERVSKSALVRERSRPGGQHTVERMARRAQPDTGAIQISFHRMQQRWPADAHSFAIDHSLKKNLRGKALGLVSFAEPDATSASQGSRVVK